MNSRKGSDTLEGMTRAWLTRAALVLTLAMVAACGDDIVAPNGARLTSFAFLTNHNPTLGSTAVATITGTDVTITVPPGTDVTALVATFTASDGARVEVGGAAQISSRTANDFTAPIDYDVLGAGGAAATFRVVVTVTPAATKAITAFAFEAARNPGLATTVTATIAGQAITATLPFGSAALGLVATFTTTGASVAVGGVAQVSGTTANDFTSPVTYTVTAEDGSTAAYTVTVTVAASDAKALTAFAFPAALNPGLAADVTATITGTAIAATVPFGTDVTALVATFSTTGVGVAIGGVAQVSGTTANDFTAALTYVVTAANGTTQAYTVTVTAAPSPAKELTAFAFLAATNPGLADDVTGAIAAATIEVTVPFGTDVTGLVATFTTTGAGVAVGGAAQTSGVTPNDFTSPVAYVVTAGDGTTHAYTVTVTVAADPAKELTSFAFLAATNPALAADVTATIGAADVTAAVPFGTDVTALIATFTTSGTGVTVGGVAQTSGATANDFTSPVTYVVTAGDGTTRPYTVTVELGPSPAKSLDALAFRAADNPDLATDVTAAIDPLAFSVTATVPLGVDVSSLVATFAFTGAGVAVGGAPQTSGATANDFTSPVTYVVTAADGSTQPYTVAVAIGAPLTCAPLAPPAGGTVDVSNGGVFPSTATYACGLGRLLDPTGATATCNPNGSWTPAAAPTCDAAVMVVKVGDGTTALSAASTEVVLEERRVSDGGVGRTIALPIAAAGVHAAFTLAGSANAEGHLSLSGDGRYVTLAGYAAEPGTAAVSGVSAATLRRVVARVDAAGDLDTTTLLETGFGGSIRGATTHDGTGFWATGANSGVRFIALGSAGATTSVSSAITNLRAVHVFGGQLFTSTESMTTGVYSVGAGLPVTGPQANALVVPVAGPHSFAFVDASGAVAGLDTLYVALNGAPGAGSNAINIQKWTFDGTTWTQTTGFAPALAGANLGALGLTAFVDGATVRVIASTTGGADNQLVAFADDGSTVTPAVTSLGTAGANRAFRGVARSPFVAP